MNIAIDGPAGAGKSTIAKQLAGALDFIYVDTGALYRSIALYMLRGGIDIADMAQVEKACGKIDIRIDYREGQQHMLLGGEDVTGLIRTEEVSSMASKVSAIPAVRACLLDMQRQIAASGDVILDGRDIGTAVLPHAEVKIYLTADAHVRAVRRYKEQVARGLDCDLESIEREIIERDDRDMHREIAPLRQAEDAVLVDSSSMSIDQVVETMMAIVKAAKGPSACTDGEALS